MARRKLTHEPSAPPQFTRIFCEEGFRKALTDYREAPSFSKLERLAADFIMPLARAFCFSRCVHSKAIDYDDRDDIAQLAAIRCIAKLHLLYCNGAQRAHPYLTKIVQHVADAEIAKIERRAKRTLSLDGPAPGDNDD